MPLRTETTDADDVAEPLEKTPLSSGDPVTVAAALSVAYSWYLFYLKEDRMAGLFVGLWAPTLLGAAAYFQQKELCTRNSRTASRSPEAALRHRFGFRYRFRPARAELAKRIVQVPAPDWSE